MSLTSFTNLPLLLLILLPILASCSTYNTTLSYPTSSTTHFDLPLSLPLRRKPSVQIGQRTTPKPRPPYTRKNEEESSIKSVNVERQQPGGPAVDGALYAGLILPYSMFHKRDYWRIVTSAMGSLKQKPEFTDLFSKHFQLEPGKHLLIRMLTFSPSPRDILSTLCDEYLESNVSAIIYLTNTELYGASTAASQYFLQLAGYLGLPVIAWNADNSGLRRRATSSSADYNTEMVLQLAPSIHHQAGAMLSILTRYNWHQFAIVTSQIAGHDDFVQAVRDKVLESEFKFVILGNVLVLEENDLLPLVGSEARILLLYCTKEEARWIMRAATKYGLTGSNYVWIVTQSVIGDKLSDISYQDLPIGMLGVHINTTIEALKSEISNAIKVFVSGVQGFRNDTRNNKISLTTNLSCDGSGDNAKWKEGDHFYRALNNVEVDYPDGTRPPLSFNADGTLRNVELQIMNLRPVGMDERSLIWEQIGVWRSWRKADEDTQLDIKDIVWPGKSHKPPDGVPEKFHLKITFLEEAPYIKMTDPDPVTGKCSPDRGVLCRINNNSQVELQQQQHHHQSGQFGSIHQQRTSSPHHTLFNSNITLENLTFLTNYQCCSGFNIDLLLKFAEDIGFTYELTRVADSKWGTYTTNKWNGLIGELTNRRADVALASLVINSEREAVVDFSVPYMDSGIAIMTAKRTGIISPTAFLEPFDASLWFLVCVVGIQAYSLFIFLFEWLSPLGFDMKKYPTPGSRFSFFRSCWLVWARLFQASVHVDPPRGFTAKFVVHVWSMFAVVFLATYTANLAVFMVRKESCPVSISALVITATPTIDMIGVADNGGQYEIKSLVDQFTLNRREEVCTLNDRLHQFKFWITREESHQFIGVHDQRLENPMSIKPPLKFGTVLNTHSASLISKHHPEMYNHMKQFNVQNVSEGVNAVRRQELDAFIYDGPVLQYEVLQDTSETCQLLIEGAWSAHSGYGLAFPRNSKYLPLFNKFLMEYKENGDLERLRRFYFTGPCAAEQSGRQTQPASIGKFNTFGTGPLALEQFLSVFLLLGIGVLVATLFVFCERTYANCIVKKVFGGKGASDGTRVVEGKNKKPPPACLQLLSQNMGLPYSRTFYRAHKRDSNIRLLDHITSSFTFYNTDDTISDYYHGFLESFVLRKMITCNDPICQRNFVKLENELKKCLVRLRQIENWGRLYNMEDRSGMGGARGGPPLMRTRISTIERSNQIVGKRICGDYSDFSAEFVPRGQFRDEVIGGSGAIRKRSGSFSGLSGGGVGRGDDDNDNNKGGIIKVAEIETVL